MSNRLRDRFNRVTSATLLGIGSLGLVGCELDDATAETVFVKADCVAGSEPSVAGILQDGNAGSKGTDSVFIDCRDKNGKDTVMNGIELLSSLEGANVAVKISYHDGLLADGKPSITLQPNVVSFYGSSDIETANTVAAQGVGDDR